MPAGFSDDSDGREIPEEDTKETTRDAKLFFDLDAANAFNKAMPVALIKDAARSNSLAPNLRRDVAQAAFARAALIDDRETASQAAVLVQEMYPQLKEFLASYQKATTPDARRFAAAFPVSRSVFSFMVFMDGPFIQVNAYTVVKSSLNGKKNS